MCPVHIYYIKNKYSKRVLPKKKNNNNFWITANNNDIVRKIVGIHWGWFCVYVYGPKNIHSVCGYVLCVFLQEVNSTTGGGRVLYRNTKYFVNCYCGLYQLHVYTFYATGISYCCCCCCCRCSILLFVAIPLLLLLLLVLLQFSFFLNIFNYMRCMILLYFYVTIIFIQLTQPTDEPTL